MKSKQHFLGLLVFSVFLFIAWAIETPPLLAQDVVVSQAIPDTSPQGTVSLNVQVKGKGFKKGAVATWLVTGSETDTGGVTVNTTTYVSPTDLIANITVAADAQTAKKFDIKVTVSGGRTGKGIELFKVIYNPPDPTIAYVATYSKGNRKDLMVMNADGTNRVLVLSGGTVSLGINNPVWSPDRLQLAFGGFSPKTGASAIYIVNKDGTGLRKVISYNGGSGYSFKISWSPVPLADGQYKIAFSDRAILANGTLRQDSDAFMVNLDGTGLTRLTDTPDIKEWDVCWSPTADRIAIYAYNYVIDNGLASLPVYSIEEGIGGFIATFLIDLMVVPGSPLKGDFAWPSWAKAHEKIAVSAPVSPGTGSYDIWAIDLTDPSNPLDLTPAPSTFATESSWSPDDSQIVFLKNYSGGPYGIWVMNSDGSGLVEIAAPGNNFSYGAPDWRRCCPTCATVCAP